MVHSPYLRTTRWQRNWLTGDIDTIFVQHDATVGLDEVFSRRIGHQGRISSEWDYTPTQSHNHTEAPAGAYDNLKQSVLQL